MSSQRCRQHLLPLCPPPPRQRAGPSVRAQTTGAAAEVGAAAKVGAMDVPVKAGASAGKMVADLAAVNARQTAQETVIVRKHALIVPTAVQTAMANDAQRGENAQNAASRAMAATATEVIGMDGKPAPPSVAPSATQNAAVGLTQTNHCMTSD